jgi:cysteine sulfinate desulfinase/cysteine desulfurase-like protein
MSVLVLEVLEVLQTLEGLSTLIVKDTTEGTRVNWLEISVSAEGRVVLVSLLEMMLRAEVLVSIRWVDNMLLDSVLKYHILFI